MSTLLLCRSEVERLLPLADCIEAVQAGFLALARGELLGPVVSALHAPSGGFHFKAAGMGSYIAGKLNANFPGNPAFGRPTIQGLVLLCDAEQGQPLGVFDSTAITALRTAAATAVAARYLAREDARVATVVGCGAQSRAQIRALNLVRPLHRVYAYDLEPLRAQQFAAEIGAELGIESSVAADPRRALSVSQICVTCTPSKTPILHPGDIHPGTFIAAVGADNGEKIEIDPALMAASLVVPDLLEQAIRIGDLHHAVARGFMNVSQVYAELPDLVAGRMPGRTGDDQVFVFDSTGVAVQDVAAAALVYQRAVAQGGGRSIEFAA
ncbi:MAG TPA: ornithine cyclodeaminase family protein [Gemmatimonadales bacterium]|jgi:ornithine cyclodeaminase/alanine dehydrogenase-like protein (mu-crystallin family)